jgi:hypothetical protein
MAQKNRVDAKKLNIAVVQVYDDNIKSYAEYSRLLNVMYAKQHRYAYIGFEYDLVPVCISVYYNKIVAVDSVLKDPRNFDWVLYIDSDAAVSNFNYKIEDIVARHKGKEIIIAQDSNGVNNGVFLIKNTDKMKEFLRKAYEDRNFFHTKTPEQAAMFHYLHTEYKNLVGTEPSHFLNAYLKGYKDLTSTKEDVKVWDETSFIVHLFRLPTADRINIFKQILLSSQITCVSKPKEECSLSYAPDKTISSNQNQSSSDKECFNETKLY